MFYKHTLAYDFGSCIEVAKRFRCLCSMSLCKVLIARRPNRSTWQTAPPSQDMSVDNVLQVDLASRLQTAHFSLIIERTRSNL